MLSERQDNIKFIPELIVISGSVPILQGFILCGLKVFSIMRSRSRAKGSPQGGIYHSLAHTPKGFSSSPEKSPGEMFREFL